MIPSQQGSLTQFREIFESTQQCNSYILNLLKNNYPILQKLYDYCLIFTQVLPHSQGKHVFLKTFESTLKIENYRLYEELKNHNNGKVFPEIDPKATISKSILYISQIWNFFDVDYIPSISFHYRYFDHVADIVFNDVAQYFIGVVKKKIEINDCCLFSCLVSSLLGFSHDFPFVLYDLIPALGENRLIFYESIFQLHAIPIQHNFHLKVQYNFFGYDSPLKECFYDTCFGRLTFQGEILNKSGNSTIVPISYLIKNDGVGKGFQIHLNTTSIFVKELFVDSQAYQEIKGDNAVKYIDSLGPNVENGENLKSKTQINPFTPSFHLRKITKVNWNSGTRTVQNISPDVLEILVNCATKVLARYINSYAEVLSYVLLYYIKLMPPLNIIRSQFTNKIYLMVDHYVLQDEELSSKYIQADQFQTEPADFDTKNLNNFACCIHSFLLFNYLFNLGDFHDGNYAICRSTDLNSKGAKKYKIVIFDLWMSPYQICCKDLLQFTKIPTHYGPSYTLSSNVYYYLYHDLNMIDETKGSILYRLMNKNVGENRLPFITIRTLKWLFKNIVNNLGLLFNYENPQKQVYFDFILFSQKQRRNNDIILLSCFLLFKLYDTSKETILKNKDLIKEYEKYNESKLNEKEGINTQNFLNSRSQTKLIKLYRTLLDINSIPTIFIRKPKFYHCIGNSDLIKEFKLFKSSYIIDTSSQFANTITSQSNIRWIFIFFSLNGNSNSFFDQSKFSTIENNLFRKYSIQTNVDNCIFTVYQSIVECDLYRMFLQHKCHFSLIDENIIYDSLLFILKKSC